MKRTVCTAYFNHRGQRLKLPHSNMSINANAAAMRCWWNMTANTYGAHSAEVYDVETAEVFAQYKQTFEKGERVVKSTYKAEPRRFGDPIKRVSAHALFHDLEVEAAVAPE